MIMNKRISGLFVTGLVAVGLLFGAGSAQGDPITLSQSDGSTDASFAAGTNWSDGLAPSAGKDYLVDGYILRTEAANEDIEFQGDSLTINGTLGRLVLTTNYKNITVADLTISNGGRILTFRTNSTQSLYGNLTVEGEGHLWTDRANTWLSIHSPITGTGSLVVRSDEEDIKGGFFRLWSGSNTYSGGTEIRANALLEARYQGTLGTGDVTVKSEGTLRLTGGNTYDYIDDSASLILDNTTTSYVDLDFPGTDTIAGLSFDGGTTWQPFGTYGATGSGADYTVDGFSGDGLLNVIPEPQTLGLILLGVASVAVRRFRRL